MSAEDEDAIREARREAADARDERIAAMVRERDDLAGRCEGVRAHNIAAVRERDEARAEVERLQHLISVTGAVISEIGCECTCACDEDHDDDCDGPCSVCRIADALQPNRGAR